MENNEILENQWDDNSDESMKEKRGTFLLVLCILSWVFIGYSFIMGLVSLAGGTQKLEEQLVQADMTNAFSQDTGNDMANSILSSANEMIIKTIENFYPLQMSNLVVLLIGALAVYMMFQLKKSGFYLYVLYTILIPAISFYFLGANMIVIMAVGLNMFFGVLFLILYGVNLKRMTE